MTFSMDVLQNAFHLEAVANGLLGTSKTTWETSEFETLPLMFSAQICYFKKIFRFALQLCGSEQ